MEENKKHWPPAPQGMAPEQNVSRSARALTGLPLVDGVLGFFVGLLGLSVLLFLTTALVYWVFPSGYTETEWIKHQEQLFCGWIFVAGLFAILCRVTVRCLRVFGVASAIGGLMVIVVLTWYYSNWFPIVFLGAPLSSARPGG